MSIENQRRAEVMALLVAEMKDVLSETSWKLGQLGSRWHERQQTGAFPYDALAKELGLTPKALKMRVAVYERFGEKRHGFRWCTFPYFQAAMDFGDHGALDALQWAEEMQALVPEMVAWYKAQSGVPLDQCFPQDDAQ